MPSEFELIARYFTRPTAHTLLGAGDDGAIVCPSPGMALVTSTDMLVAGTHFMPGADPEALGWKTLAVNLSDLAAMGAQPRWALLAASLPEADESWIAAFASGFFACAAAFNVDVIGGDTTRGPLNFCVNIIGEVPVVDDRSQALLRSGAQPGDEIWVSGAPGRAALGLAHLQGRIQLNEPARSDCLAALHRPQPRVALGIALRGLANAAIDISDGLLADLGHILERSKVCATLQLERMPGMADNANAALAQDCLLAGGDDYELVFTAPASRHATIAAFADSLNLALTCIGHIAEGASGELVLLDAEGKAVPINRRGFDHFA
ncbi:MAG: thiamine-phosphate kinase [Betaproteobacteria bacterium]|nr:thiamine-phosphate kinase [Betaproteobacteria bacterium]